MFVNGQIDKLDDRLFLFIKVLIAGLGLKVQGVDPKRGSERVAQALNGVVELVGVIFVGHRGAQRNKFTEDALLVISRRGQSSNDQWRKRRQGCANDFGGKVVTGSSINEHSVFTVQHFQVCKGRLVSDR